MNPAPPRTHLQAPASVEQAVAPSLSQRNRVALAKLASSGDALMWRRQRDGLVRDNLPLVYAIAGRMSRPGSLPFEDLSQVGSLGLLRAIEAFQPSKGRSLSSFAVPYIRGAMQHELRDRQSLMKIPRELWELRRQATLLQERCRQDRSTPLCLGALARSLGCEGPKLQEAMSLQHFTAMRSLDAPSRQAAGADEATTSLLEVLADPASLTPGDAAAASGADPAERDGPISARRQWLRQQLAALPQLELALIVGHLTTDASWVDLGQELGLHPRQAQRRYQAGLSRLQQQASQWSAEAVASVQPDTPARPQAPVQTEFPGQPQARSRRS